MSVHADGCRQCGRSSVAARPVRSTVAGNSAFSRVARLARSLLLSLHSSALEPHMKTLRTPRISSLSLVLFAAGALAACGSDSDSTAVEGSLDPDSIQTLEALADRAVEAGIPGVSVAIVSGDQTVLIARGVADRESGEAMTPDHRFRVASITKSLVASVVLQLVGEGRLALTDTVEDWLPGALPENADATIEDLLRLESGIFSFDEDERLMAPYYAGDFGYTWQPEELVGLAAAHPALFPPGERFYYSNTNYVLLALIVQKITGDTLSQSVHDRITAPLDMSSSVMATRSELEAPYSHGYMLGLSDEPVDVTGISASSVFGNGNLVSTALDSARFFGALVNGRVVSDAQLPRMLASRRPGPNSGTSYGMGVWLSDEFYPCGQFVGHDGAGPGYLVTAQSSRDGSRQFAVLTNVLAPGDVAGDERAQHAFKELVLAAACQ
jgi:D-alanyl-D-alanine carboxypeptidase